MGNVGLFYVGAVLFLNSFLLLGKIHAKSAAIFNLFIGFMQVVFPILILIEANGDKWLIYNTAGTFLFGFTYLFVGFTNLFQLDSTGVGLYSLWVAIIAVAYSLINFLYFHDIKFGIIWIMWAFLWGLFYVLLGLKKEISIFTGWVTFIESWLTATIPAFLSMIGIWENVSDNLAITIGILFSLIVIILFRKTSNN
ncbi:AmiS/UreI family transporter [Tepidibacillus sp. HK-1]|uniref:AmiS/UreI family transporter n=1 Tax=Tepidibacillus sp. HK-1 TaxID=1883407 RepID=UPI0008539F51|nr:AmiS/UreI family transporter [Tepidibacillus sp. HK-1]GBF10733.1 acid-activated urea channel [Tepidibacillus sp. HK-1]